jgi:hypothetical protein
MLQVEYPLSIMLGTRSISDFRDFWLLDIFMYMMTYFGMGHRSKQENHLCFIYIDSR